MPSVAGQYVIGGGGRARTNEEAGIREVWQENLDEAFVSIRNIIQQYKYVAMDTEFPGVVAKPIGEFSSSSEYQYQVLRCNVDLLKIIQLGLSFFDDNGLQPKGISTWQFNFKFSLTDDMYAQDSIELLTNSGLQFSRHEEDGIDPNQFAEILMSSGVIIFEDVHFLSFHSGYDFGYLIKLLTSQNLPMEESKFFEVLNLYFPAIYDVKYLMKSCKNLKGGLQEVSEQLEVERVGPQHQAGSDSRLTGDVFFKMRELYFERHIDDEKYCGNLYGLGTQHVQNGADSQSPPLSVSQPVNAPGVATAGTNNNAGAVAAATSAATNNTNSTPTNTDGNSDSDGVSNADNGHDAAASSN